MRDVDVVDALELEPSFDHLWHLTDDRGLFEHALFDQPRVDLGYTTDDNARALVVMSRTRSSQDVVELEPFLSFVVDGAVAGGWHNRMGPSGQWSDRRGSDDCHGRAIWGLGEAIAAGVDRADAFDVFQAGIHTFDSTHPRAMAYAVLGASSVLGALSGSPFVEGFIEVVASRLPRPVAGPWRWPADRLTYDNARLPQALVAAGRVMSDDHLIGAGLELLEWLMETEQGPNGFSFTPVGGRGPASPKPAFDQQPIEAWAMADACAAAMDVDSDSRWRDGVVRAVGWFHGNNDAGHSLYDPVSGAGYDGLQRDGVNQNRGAESTLSALGAIIGHAQLSIASG